MKQTKIAGVLMLMLATLIWGCAFVAQSVSMDHLGPMTFQTARSCLAVLALVPTTYLFDRQNYIAKWKDPRLWKAGLLCGLALFAATGLQQIGLQYTLPGKAGFITAMYIVLVPLFGLFHGRKCPGRVWAAVVLAAVGLYLLSCAEAAGIALGDLLILLCAGCFAVQILLIDGLGQGLDGLRLNLIQFMVVAVLSGICMALTERPSLEGLLACAGPIAYTGLLSSAAAYSLQILGQQRLDPAPASLIMSLESVFAVLSGWILLNQVLTPTELLGCALVFGGVLLSQTAA